MEGPSGSDDIVTGVELLSGPWDVNLKDLVRSARHDLCLVSPFLRKEPLEMVSRTLDERSPRNRPDVRIVTNLHAGSLLDRSLDVAALASFVNEAEGSDVVHLPALHAKVYMADSHAAIVTSANLTNGGLWRNREYGVLLRNRQTVCDLRQDIGDYAALGSVIEISTLVELARETERLRSAQIATERSADSRARARLASLLAETRDLVLLARARGKTTTGILADTIIYLLQRRGPLTTQALHPLVQALHPDICDDSEDRVIDGVHFGKKWKHHVRNAQQQLRRQGTIERLADGRWALTDSGRRD